LLAPPVQLGQQIERIALLLIAARLRYEPEA
jgi:hypothetical protein